MGICGFASQILKAKPYLACARRILILKWTAIGTILIALVVAAFFVISEAKAPGPISVNPEAEKLYHEGTADIQAFKLKAGLGKLEQALELDPNLAEAAISLATGQLVLGRSSDYKISLTRADSLAGLITDDQRRMIAQLRLSGVGKSCFRAIRDSLLARLGNQQPDNIFVMVALAGSAMANDDDIEAKRIYERILETNPNYAVSYNMLGYMELRHDHFAEAIAYMQKYAFLAPNLANPHDSLGEVFLVMGRYEEAEREFIQAITIDEDFYHSLINLGRVYMARGQINKGVGILEKVRVRLAGSTLEQRIDVEILHTYLISGLEGPLGKMSETYINRYPDSGTSIFFRAIRLARQGQMAASQAVMDSSLTVWRKSPGYACDSKQQLNVESTAKRYQAIISDLADSPATRVQHWSGLVAMIESDHELRDQIFDRWMLGQAQLDNGAPALALVQADLMLDFNPRQINFIILQIECHLALGNVDKANAGLEQLKWSLSQADADFPALARIPEFEKKLLDLNQSL